MTEQDHGWIRLTGLQVRDCHVGIYPHEQQLPQTLQVDIGVWAAVTPAANSEDVANTINYDSLARLVIEVCRRRHFPLLETVAETLAAEVLEATPAERVTLEVHKPGVYGAAVASVAIERSHV